MKSSILSIMPQASFAGNGFSCDVSRLLTADSSWSGAAHTCRWTKAAAAAAAAAAARLVRSQTAAQHLSGKQQAQGAACVILLAA
jgi:hypothetical protein